MEKIGFRSKMGRTSTRPMFSFYGSKWRAVPYYPIPTEGSIIEPFAGSACYAMNYYDRAVHINDLDPVIYGLWDYLTKVSAAEVRSLPIDPERLDTLDSQPIPQEAKYLIGFWLCKAYTYPVSARVGWARTEWDKWKDHYWSEGRRERVAAQVDHIRHWRVTNLPYTELENVTATWFIDPPYAGIPGKHYVKNNAALDFSALAHWCRNRFGQVIVCEGAEADWLDFKPLGDFKSAKKGKKSSEAVWLKSTKELQ